MKIETERTAETLVVRIATDTLDASNSRDFKKQFTDAVGNSQKVIFDLSGLRFVDSSGLGALLSCLRQLNAAGGDLKLCGLAKPVRALFELVRMHKIFEIFNNRDEAIRSFAA